ncbi:hypothetical protein V5F77_00715 [Xanthobacter sp. DSM 24535]|uniref:hypothetical protein n=1 Tax=Roseixanthobacter psychrophilus TaxID=3119917 RepID=UPI00372B8997
MQLDGAIDHIGSDKPPIFVHSSYRTSSTWFWSKLRAAPSVLAYCEIFNEALAKVTRETIEAQRAESWASGHPSVAPYFLEFLPLLTQEQGLPLYDRSMPFEHFMPADGMGGALSEAETAYVASLIANAHACGKVPVLTDTSTLGRIRAFKQAFSGPAIFLHRNLFHQWASYSKQSVLGNQYFIHTTEWAMAGSQGDPFIRHLADFFAKRTREPDDEQTFLTFVLFHLYLYAHALEDVDMVLDVDALASDPAVRSVAERQIGEWVGADIDLSDCRPHFELSLVTCRSKTAMVDTIEQFVKLIAATVRTEAAVAGIEKMKDALLREWERNEFYSGALRTHHRAQVAKAAAQDAEWQAEREAASAQLVELEARHGDLRAAHEAMSSEAAGLRETVAALSAALDEATVRLRDAETRQAALQADHDALASEAGALREAAAAALLAHEQAVARMQALEASQAALQAEHVEALSRLEARSRGIARFWGR